MIKPTVGRVVWFYEPFVAGMPVHKMAAIVTYVHSDRLVNLAVFDVNGNNRGATSVVLRQPEDIAPAGPFCEWIPYQVGQAKANEPSEPPPTDNDHVAKGCEKFDTIEPTGDAPEVQAEAPIDNGEPDTAPEPYTGDK